MTLDPLLDALAGCRIVDLAHPLHERIPVSPNHPGFRMSLTRRHGDRVRADGGSAASELMVLGGHSGTHLDALGHVSHEGRLHGGHDADAAQRGGRLAVHGIDAIAPVVGRGVLLDVAAARGVDVLPAGEAVTVAMLEAAVRRQGLTLRPGDTILVRTGWARHWEDPDTFAGQVHGAPGPDADAGRWLAAQAPRMVGGETLAFEHIPAGAGHAHLPVHRTLLVEAGVPILECLDLRALEASTFVFVLAPLRVVGATGVPVRPLALVTS